MRLLSTAGPAVAAALALSVALTAACTSAAPAAGPSGGGPSNPGPRPVLTGAAPCPDDADLSCATLTVPLDHSGARPGTLGLRVAMTGNAAAPKGDLVFLSGGPGQPDEPFGQRITARLQPVLAQYRLVFLDQRGTGDTALHCPELQQQMGSSDLTPPTAGAVAACAAALGDGRRFYSTADTVADLDLLRQALGADRISLDGVSYGTFTAERYALAHPAHTARLVLDSVVPQTGYDPLDLAALQAVPRVLAASCAAIHCGTDPAADLAAVVHRDHDGVTLLDTLTSYEFVDPNYSELITALHESATGHPEHLNAVVAAVRQSDAADASQLSAGLHTATLCSDGHYPWGTADTPPASRRAALTAAHDRLTAADVGPFDADTATGLGSLLACLTWPREQVPASPPPERRIPGSIPVLLLGGDRDLSTPLAWLHDEQRLVADAQVVIVPGAAHSVQSRATSDAGRRAVFAFLLGG
ncbi:alpha/beta fold hydrolase [Streptacidiphilus rugosus]|uniref:alpha/beta fold hydrolase n=1 Tax=Streptacidiphilus rugosus TaxID=405783 RepID=UPI000690EA6B|nr:alpha/beta fold hydrolase [Streptacidiphilus rugosus]